jgi:hypothetical protein
MVAIEDKRISSFIEACRIAVKNRLDDLLWGKG